MTDKKVTIEMTERQARNVLEAVEEWIRLRLAQRSTPFQMGSEPMVKVTVEEVSDGN